ADKDGRFIVARSLESVRVRHNRQVLEQVLVRILNIASSLSRNGSAHLTITSADGRVRLDIVPPNSDVAHWLADWLNISIDEADFGNGMDIGLGVSMLVAGNRLRMLEGTAEIVSDSDAPIGIAVSFPQDLSSAQEPVLHRNAEPAALSVLVAEDC